MPRKPDPEPDPEPANDPSESFAQHKAARALLASSLAEYKDKLTPELENVLSAKALTIAQA